MNHDDSVEVMGSRRATPPIRLVSRSDRDLFVRHVTLQKPASLVGLIPDIKEKDKKAAAAGAPA